MAPRRYRMQKRTESVEDTRRRIIESTVQLHGEKGVLNTTVADVASRADVALGTVYRHFPRMEDLVFACGQVVWAASGIPNEGSIAPIPSLQERVSALIDCYSGTYEGFLAHGFDQNALRYEATKMKPLADWFADWDARHRLLVEEVLGARAQDSMAVAVLLTLSGWSSWRTLTLQGLESAAAASILKTLAINWLTGGGPT